MATTVEIPEYEVRQRVTLDPARTALVIIDMQNDFVREEGTLQVEDAQATVPAIRHLLDLARESGMRVVFSQDTHDAGDPEFEIWPAHALRGTWGWEMIGELAPPCQAAPRRRSRPRSLLLVDNQRCARRRCARPVSAPTRE